MESLIKSHQLFSQKEAKTIAGKIIQFPLVRIIIALAFLIVVLLLHNLAYDKFIFNLSDDVGYYVRKIETILNIVLLFLVYRLYVKFIEQRRAFEISGKKAISEIGMGFLLGGGLIIFLVSMLYFFGFYEIQGTNSPEILLSKVFRYSIGSLIEEFIFTIIIFRLFEEFIGSLPALILSSLFFGFAHYFNDNASVWSSIAIALSNPLILAPFILTRRIWMPWALHFSWNYFQTGVFNMPNSGQVQGGFLQSTVNGPEWLTGGFFGIEASYVAVALNFILGLLILYIAIKNGQWLKPRWMRN